MHDFGQQIESRKQGRNNQMIFSHDLSQPDSMLLNPQPHRSKQKMQHHLIKQIYNNPAVSDNIKMP
jgi:hypothetical protein